MKKYIGIFSILLLFAVGGNYIFTNSQSDVVKYFHTEYITDFSDSRKAAGFADNIFVGKVNKNLGLDTSDPDRKYPNTLFSISVLKNIKGELIGETIVAQGISQGLRGETIIMNEGDTLMKPGEIYLFTTRGENPGVINGHMNGKHKININEKEKISFGKEKKIVEFINAYENEIISIDDDGELYQLSSGKNNYKKLSKEEKKLLKEMIK